MKKDNSFAVEVLKDYKKQNRKLFIIWVFTFIALIGISCYTIYLLNDIETVKTTANATETIDIDDVNEIHDSNIHN